MTSSDTYTPTPMGLSWKFTGNSTNSGLDFGTFNPITTSDGAGTGDFTILAFGNPTSQANLNVLFDQRKGSGSLERIGLIANSTKAGVISAGGLALLTTSTGGVTAGARGTAGGVDGLPHVWAGRRSGTAHSVWKDGIDTTSASDASANAVWSTAQKLEIGAQADYTGADMGANCSIALCLAWNRALSNYEMGQIGRNSWQIFKATQPRFYFAGTAAGGATRPVKMVGRWGGFAGSSGGFAA